LPSALETQTSAASSTNPSRYFNVSQNCLMQAEVPFVVPRIALNLLDISNDSKCI
jgi:hypothetical protein